MPTTLKGMVCWFVFYARCAWNLKILLISELCREIEEETLVCSRVPVISAAFDNLTIKSLLPTYLSDSRFFVTNSPSYGKYWQLNLLTNYSHTFHGSD